MQLIIRLMLKNHRSGAGMAGAQSIHASEFDILITKYNFSRCQMSMQLNQ
jgi:hypothetical protein